MAERFRHTNTSPVFISLDPLTTLLHRLEAATSRLEDIASSSQPSDGGSSVQSPAPAAAAKLAAGVPDKTDIPRTESQSSARTASPNLPPAINDMDALIQKEVQTFIESSKSIDPLVKEQAQAVAKGFADQRRFLIITTKAKKPDPQSQTLMALLKDLQQDLGTAGDIKDGNRGSPMKEHLAMVAEGISTLQWLLMEGKPADVVGEIIGGAQMYGNRVLKAYKDGYVDQNFEYVLSIHTDRALQRPKPRPIRPILLCPPQRLASVYQETLPKGRNVECQRHGRRPGYERGR